MTKPKTVYKIIIRETAPEYYVQATRAAIIHQEDEHKNKKYLEVVFDNCVAYCWKNQYSVSVKIVGS